MSCTLPHLQTRESRRAGRALTVCGIAVLCLALGFAARARADEIRLKDGNKLYGVIVAYEDNMFKVRTPFGYVLVEKDKIAEIVPSTIGAADSSPEAKANAKRDLTAATKKNAPAKAVHAAPPTAEPMSAAESDAASAAASAATSSGAPPGTPAATEVSERTVDPAVEKREKTAAIMANTTVKPQLPAPAAKKVVAPAIRPAAEPALPTGAAVSSTAAPVAPQEPDVLPEEIRGNLYVNHANGFTIYKAPSWNLIEDARKALPNAMVAMGTFNESTLLVVGKEKNKEALETAATAVERRLREVYDNYRQISRRTTAVNGLPGIEYRFRGMADEHDWSGTLVVLTRNGETFTILGMTYADTDLIQIQENVIARSIASLKFSSANSVASN
ncbi:MAG TPA: hypothetical protein VKF79_04385 [Candidatus Acidoferrum sp.]|nr:hypothetical protein [Candidatus Acidoferrum sp.]